MTTNKRRDLLKAGAAAVAATPAIFGGAMLPRLAQAQVNFTRGMITPENEPASPHVPLFTQPVYIPPAAKPVDPASLTPGVNPDRHQRYAEFPAVHHYVQNEAEGYWNYHPALSSLNAQGGSLAWMFNNAAPGETFVAKYGEPFFIRRTNNLPLAENTKIPFGYPATTTHLHNSHSASESDGYPMDFIEPGQFWDHHHPMIYARNDPNEALASLWYHDHMIDFTATNVYAGLSGMCIFYDHIDSGDENDTRAGALRLPGGYGKYDLYFILHDVRFNQQGHPEYNIFNTDGHLGDVITVNRKAFPYFQVERRKYRLRFLDGGPSRFYELRFADKSPFFVITNDGNLLETPVEATSIVLGVANRHDVIVDFSKYAPGTSIVLENVMEQTNGQGPTGKQLDPGMPVMRFDVIDSNVVDNSRIPDFLRKLPSINLSEVVAERDWVFDHDMGLWTVNGQFMDPTISSAEVRQGTAEIWNFRNAGTSWAHPVHVHFEEFQVIEWNGRAPTGVLKSRKDVATLGPGDTAKVFYRFDDYLGKYPIHCHNNVHEDNAMMLRWDIIPNV
ncbi:MAG: multicopper oxidase domain-containing protein [Lysobacter sp.]|nr:multicopper oxidase domain-containing protein [Lysobacter sp.]MDQ3269221.1 multicopper oxidase domain-containing protein [Pseudomonadota bacterium]